MVPSPGSEAGIPRSINAPGDLEPLWVLANRRAGRGRALRLATRIEPWFAREGLPVRFFWPESREQLRELAAQAIAAGRRRLVVLGGDGTLLDVVDRIRGQGIELGLIPAGDANDVVAALALPRDPFNAARLLLAWQTRPIDLIRVCTTDGREYVYTGAGGAGLDAEAACLAARSFRRLPRRSRYLAAAVVAFARGNPFPVEVRLDDGREIWSGSASLVAIANAPTYGGGIQIAHGARMDDGRLDVTVVESLDAWRVLRVLPALASSGRIRGLKLARFRARSVRVETARAVAFHGDGELLGQTPLYAEVLPGALRVVSPPVRT